MASANDHELYLPTDDIYLSRSRLIETAVGFGWWFNIIIGVPMVLEVLAFLGVIPGIGITKWQKIAVVFAFPLMYLGGYLWRTRKAIIERMKQTAAADRGVYTFQIECVRQDKWESFRRRHSQVRKY